MKTLSFCALIVPFALAACGGADDDFLDGFPDAEVIKVKTPESSGSALTSGDAAVQTSDLEGDRARFYTMTREVTKGINGGVLWVLGLVKAITRQPATTRDGDTRIWGPGSDPLDPNIMRFTMVKNQNAFRYVLEGRKKTAPEGAWGKILEGQHVRSGARGRGTGSFTLDFDAVRANLESDGDDVGNFTAEYNASGPGVTLAVHFRQVRDRESGNRMDAEYRYAEDAVRNGAFEFVLDKNLEDTATAALEHLTIKSRWGNDGAGRSDVRASGGDLPTEHRATECWNKIFQSVYFTNTWGGGGWGAESACSIAGASYAEL